MRPRVASLVALGWVAVLGGASACDPEPRMYVVTSAPASTASSSRETRADSGAAGGPGCLVTSPAASASAGASAALGMFALPLTHPTVQKAIPAFAAPLVRPAAPPVAPVPAVASLRCDPPYYYDANGTRVFKEECL
jgi:hypothetical protein